jgi:hypothetical protein
VNKGEYIRKSLANAISSHSNIGQSRMIKTCGYTMTVTKTVNFSNPIAINEGLTKVDLPPLTDLNYENITITVS